MNNCFPVVQDFCPYCLGDAWVPSIVEFGPIRVKDPGADWLAGIVSARMQLRLGGSAGEGKALIVRDGTVLAVEPEEMLIHEQ